MQPDTNSKSLWKKRSSVPAKSILTDAGMLMQAAFEYFEWAEKTPHYSTEWRPCGRSLEKVKTPLVRVFSMGGLALFMGMTESAIKNFRATRLVDWSRSESPEDKARAEEFAYVLDWIDNVIRVQKYEKAVVGQFKERIIMADLGMADRSINENISWQAGSISREEAKKISDELEQQF